MSPGTAAHLIATLTKAHGDGRLDENLKLFTTPRLLIIDEIGYLPIDRLGANLFFQLISRRYGFPLSPPDTREARDSGLRCFWRGGAGKLLCPRGGFEGRAVARIAPARRGRRR